jgi:hypothetical protein
MMTGVAADLAADFGWLRAPILNPRTRLAMVADAREGRLIAQGFENEAPATRVLSLAV